MSKFMNELEAGLLLQNSGIPIIKNFCCKTPEDAENKLSEINFPAAMKILSKDIQHKTDAGCVILGVKDKEDGLKAYDTIIKNALNYNSSAVIDGVLIQEMAPKGLETIIGMKRDPQFGPVIMAGTGGIYVEVFKDIALRLAPLSREDAVEMIKETKLYSIINGARGVKYDLDCFADAVVKLSELSVKSDDIAEIDINPFFLYENGGKGVDALIKMS